MTVLSRFRRDDTGSTAMLWALMVIPIAVIVGAAIDFSRNQSNAQALSSNLDSATIAAARFVLDAEKATPPDVKGFAENYLQESFAPDESKTLENVSVHYLPEGSVTISADSKISSTMLSLAGISTLSTSQSATVKFVNPSGLRAVLVLDNSSSMQGEKLDALEEAATDFVDQLMTDGDDNSYVGVVPFSHYVNVGMNRDGESWLSVPSDSEQTKNKCYTDSDASEALGCVEETYTCEGSTDGVSYEKTCSNWSCPADVTPVVDCVDETRPTTWCGAVNSRQAPLHLVDEDYDDNPVFGYLSAGDWECNTPILPMSNNKSEVSDYLDDLVARGDTYIATGLMWGYRVLSPSEPFSELAGKTSGKPAIVLMSDGENTKSVNFWGDEPDEVHHYGGDKTEANQTTLDTCEYIKAKSVEIYAIAFQVDDPDTISMLKDCATSYMHYFDAGSMTELNTAFNQVADSFRDIALAE